MHSTHDPVAAPLEASYNPFVHIEKLTSPTQKEYLFPLYLSGSRITLRHLSLGFSYTEVLQQYYWGLDEELQYLGGNVVSAPTVPQFEEALRAWIAQQEGDHIYYAILNEHKDLLGMVGYYNIIPQHRADLGIYIGDKCYWGRGYGTEAILTLLRHVFYHTHLVAIYLTTYASNGRAQACYRKCGFEVVSTTRTYSHLGYAVDVQMRITREEFLARHGNGL